MGTSALLSPGLLFLLAGVAAAGTDRPNIVIIVADDMGFNDVGFHGGDIKTPNIDALAGHGIILNRHYSQPSCTPSRTALQTGRYPSKMGMQGKPLPAGVAGGLPLTEKVFPQYFHQLGYTTHLIGKWHLGYETWAHMPTRRGFDTFFGYLNGLIGYWDAVHTQSGLSGRDFWQGEEHVWRDVYGHYVSGVLTDEAVRVIGSHEGYGGLLMFLNHLAPHYGNLDFRREAPPTAQSNFTIRQIYGEMVRWVDDSVGAVVAALEKRGILNNTIILFMSDNGAPTEDLLWGYSNQGSNWPFRGEKMSMYDGGVRTAAVLWSPAVKQPRITNQLFDITDWLPTLFSAAGGSSSDLKKLDGVDQWASLTSATEGPRQETLIGMDETYGIEALIKGEWKIIKDYQPSDSIKHVDFYYGDSGRSSTYDSVEVEKSQVGKILGPPAVPHEEVRRLASPNGGCVDKNASISTDCHSKYCLYPILEDPWECRDRSRDYPLIVAELKARLDEYRTLLLPRPNREFDPRSDPAYWDDYWSPWLDGPTSPSSSPSLANSLTLPSAIGLCIMNQLHHP